MFDEKSAVCPNGWVFGKREPNINMVNEEILYIHRIAIDREV